jgi:hypothetical protein
MACDDPNQAHEDALIERFGIDDPPEHARFEEDIYGIDRPDDGPSEATTSQPNDDQEDELG